MMKNKTLMYVLIGVGIIGGIMLINRSRRKAQEQKMASAKKVAFEPATVIEEDVEETEY